MSTDFSFSIKTLRFDEHYQPSESTRITTNFANLARGADRENNLRNALTMINNRSNETLYESGKSHCANHLKILNKTEDLVPNLTSIQLVAGG